MLDEFGVPYEVDVMSAHRMPREMLAYGEQAAGRGLGHTGGTLDKLESIPGFTAEISKAQIRQQLCDMGAAIFAAGELAPADRKIYADVDTAYPNMAVDLYPFESPGGGPRAHPTDRQPREFLAAWAAGKPPLTPVAATPWQSWPKS